MPIHIRAEPGDYAEACLLPGDPLRAQYIAETYLDNPVQRNSERGMLGYTGEFEGRPVSVQATGMGCPSAAIVIEELVQLGVKRLLRTNAGFVERSLEAGAALAQVANTLQHGKRRVSLVQMKHLRLESLCSQHSPAADPENQFLFET